MSKQKVVAGVKQTAEEKVARIPIKIEKTEVMPRKPAWIRAKAPTHPNVKRLKKILREQKLFTVCEEASCPNLGECFGHGTATFMIMLGMGGHYRWMPMSHRTWQIPYRPCS